MGDEASGVVGRYACVNVIYIALIPRRRHRQYIGREEAVRCARAQTQTGMGAMFHHFMGLMCSRPSSIVLHQY